jgi:hypothetical protein
MWTTAWVFWQGDSNHGDDTLTRGFTVLPRDIGVEEILAPLDTVGDSIFLRPECVVGNYGVTTETFEVRFQIALFEARETVVGMPGLTIDTVVFSDMWLTQPGVWMSRAEVVPNPPDMNPGNNVMYDTFWVIGQPDRDVRIVDVLFPLPGDPLVDTTLVEPAYVVENLGGYTETFWSVWKATDSTGMVYLDSSQVVDLVPGETREVRFSPARFNPNGRHLATCSLRFPHRFKRVYWFFVVPVTGIKGQKVIPKEWYVTVRPNPFGSHTQCEIGLPKASFVCAAVYSASGQLVRELESATLAPGRYRVAWDGRDDAGREVGRGVYHLRFEAGEYRSTHKLVKAE